MEFTGNFFTTIYGRNLIGELPQFVHRPYLVVTMEDLWEKFSGSFDKNLAGVYFVHSLEYEDLVKELDKLPACSCVIGLGGGQALDVAKFFVWNKLLPLFQVPTAMTVNAAFGHRTAVRFDSKVRYIGWAVPEAVYVDFDVIQQAPASLNRSGVGDIFCYHTALYDWKLAAERGRTEAKWPYDASLAAESQQVLDSVLAKLDDIREVNEVGIRTLMNANRWGGAAFHNAGWNPRHIEGMDHFLFYTLEYLTHKPFIHGQPVCLGVYVGSELQGNRAEEMLAAIHRVGVDIRPEAMGVTWEEAAEAMRKMGWYAQQAGLWYTTASEKPVTEELIAHVRERIYATYGPWEG
ncbi:MAG: iron-containing alcohol dehydrogenase [Chloroflexi bacterium]|nr:iron-containing alcohol dehydrogenase [Chloroflexota bacterium]